MVKCKTCGEPIVIFIDGMIVYVLDKPYYGETQIHLCEAEGEYEKIFSKDMMKRLSLYPKKRETTK